MSFAEDIKQLDDKYVLHTYARAPFVLQEGKGVRVYDSDGKSYLDFVSGIAVNALGYGDAQVLQALTQQASRLMHVSNLYLTAPQAQLAEMLVRNSFGDKVFFCNSGTEAVEAALKFARKWAKTVHSPEKSEVLAFSDAFHGRTLGALSITPRAHYQDPFRPLVPGAKFAIYNDLDSAAAMLDERTCACIVEPLQGEGGVNLAQPGFLQGLRRLCDERKCLLIVDEVQCGLGRTGTLWAHEPSGIRPDIMTLAKPLGGGLPLGAVLMTDDVASVMAVGDHGSTFAANPLVCAVAQTVLGRIAQPAFLAHVCAMGAYLHNGLVALQAKYDCIRDVRGLGLIWGVVANSDVAPIIDAGYAHGLLTCKAGAQVLRLLPPLIVGEAEIDEALAILDKAFAAA